MNKMIFTFIFTLGLGIFFMIGSGEVILVKNPIFKTGQNKSYLAGDDGESQRGIAKTYSLPIAHSEFKEDFITKDNATGLIWKTCTEGLSGQNCSLGTPAKNDWATSNDKICKALNRANSGKGYSGINSWRVPTLEELSSLLDSGTTKDPSINTNSFPGTAEYPYWTSSNYSGNMKEAWTVIFYKSSIQRKNKFTSANLRCVSGSFEMKKKSFVDKKDGTILDNSTGILWQKCSSGQENDATCSGEALRVDWKTAVVYCDNLVLAGKSWKLPNRSELQSIADPNKSKPALNPLAFPNTNSDNYWSSTSIIQKPSDAWIVDMTDGSLMSSSKGSANHVRCIAVAVASAKKVATNSSDPEKEPIYESSEEGPPPGTIKDKYTGLLWQKCSMGQNEDEKCSGKAFPMNWERANNYCSTLNLGNQFWRLPTIIELSSIIDTGKIKPAIDSNNFPSTMQNHYWSSTVSAGGNSSAWLVDFNTGTVEIFNENQFDNYFVRCVSGESTLPKPAFSESKKGVLKDRASKLVWQKCSGGQANDEACTGKPNLVSWEEANVFCNQLSLNGKPWRLPTLDELQSLVEYSKSEPSIDIKIFPGTVPGNYWSSTIYSGYSGNAWAVSFSNGSTSHFGKNTKSQVRCVSGN